MLFVVGARFFGACRIRFSTASGLSEQAVHLTLAATNLFLLCRLLLQGQHRRRWLQ